MPWLRLDDNMLDHPKWRRAIREGGDGVVAVWVRLTSWCSRNLTDGVVPADMVATVASVRCESRSRALRALADSGLISRSPSGDVVVTDYLERNLSREEVLNERSRRSQSQRARRVAAAEAELHETSDEGCNDVPSHPIPSHPLKIQTDAREPIDATALHREPEGAGTRRPCWWNYPPGWHWSEATTAAALEQGVSAGDLGEHVAYWTTHEFTRPVTDLDRELQRSIPAIRKRRETAAFKGQRAGPTDALQRAANRVQMLRAQEAEQERQKAAGGNG